MRTYTNRHGVDHRLLIVDVAVLVGDRRVAPYGVDVVVLFVGAAVLVSDLRVVRDEIFGMKDAMMDAAEIVPMINPRLAGEITEAASKLDTSEINGVVVMLTLMVSGALWMVRGRIKPE